MPILIPFAISTLERDIIPRIIHDAHLDDGIIIYLFEEKKNNRKHLRNDFLIRKQ